MFEESRYLEKTKALAMTMTGEPYQPARLYYSVGQKNAVLGRFKRLKCIDYSESRKAWVWLYKEEAQKIKFKKSYKEIDKESRPIILGYWKFTTETELILDVCSLDRVIEAILFFESKINRRLAKIEKIRIVNKLFEANRNSTEMSRHHQKYFEETEVVNAQEKISKIEEIAAYYSTTEERQQAVMSYLTQQMSQKLPLVEELQTHFYEDGIGSLKMSLNSRHREVLEHWRGNKNFSQLDIMRGILQKVDFENK